MQPAFAFVIALVACVSSAAAAERAWELRGEFRRLKPGDPATVVVGLADGREIELPLEALSPASQAAVRAAMAETAPAADGAAAEGDAVTVRGPFGRPVRVSVPEIIKDVEADAIHCRTAAAAADVYRLFLAGEAVAAERRKAAEARLREWSAMADDGLVRLGDRWVSPADASAAAAEADRVVDYALELLRIGNGDLAENELRKAARIDPESGRASFVMGLCYALVAKNPAKAAEQFGDVVSRQPGDAAAINDLAVVEVLARRYADVAGHFLQAAENAGDVAVVGDNVAWAVRLAGAAKVNPALSRAKMPEKTVEDLNSVYRLLTQQLKVKPADNVAEPQYLGPGGGRCSAASLADVSKHCAEAPKGWPTTRWSLGFVIAPGRIVCPRHVVVADGVAYDEIEVASPKDGGRWIPALVVAAPDDCAAALLMCDELAVEPLGFAEVMPPLPEIVAVGPSGGNRLDVRPVAARGKVVTPGLQVQALGRFTHTAVVARGLGGGPIVDAAGRVVGVVAATPRTDSSGNAAGFGIPMERIRAGLGQHLPKDLAPDAGTGSDLAAAERRAIAGTVLVSARRGRSTTTGNERAAPR